MTLSILDKRLTDNMELKVDPPQEEELALSNMMSHTYYSFWFFSKRWIEHCDRYLLFNDITEGERWIFMDIFMRLVKVSLWNMNGTQYLNKNPPHMGCVKTLLETLPNTKFIYLKRNPHTVLESTRSLFTNTVQPLRLQDIMNKQIEADFTKAYRRLFYKYEEEKCLIPGGNLVEVKFEDFEKDAFVMMENIYGLLNSPGFEKPRADIEKHLGKKEGYKENQYKHEDRTVRLVEENWGVVLKEWGYSL